MRCDVLFAGFNPLGRRGTERMLISCHDGVSGDVTVDLAPDGCMIKWIEAYPRRKGLGSAAVPLAEERLREVYSCDTVWVDPMSGESEGFWNSLGYSWMSDRGFRRMGKAIG